jgi:hypothetical protein
MDLSDTCICIPSYRGIIKTLDNYAVPQGMEVFIVADPDKRHTLSNIYAHLGIVTGKQGMAAQVAECYRVAARAGYKFYFRLDDDIQPKAFVHKDGHFPDLTEVITECRKAAEETNTKLVGLNNTTNRHWMGEGYSRTYGLVHGGAHLCVAETDPSKYIDESIQYSEDVYRSLAHRLHDGAVGRVKHIGINKKGSTARVVEAKEKHKADIELILKTFPGMVTCEGTKEINAGMDSIANWRYRKTPQVTKGNK